MGHIASNANADRAVAAAAEIADSLPLPPASTTTDLETSPSPKRLDIRSITYLQQPESQRGTVLYLAYGSNLSNETFRDSRGIKPLAQVNVQVPSLRLTFDLPGIAYTEPCFANSALRDPGDDHPLPPSQDDKKNTSEKCALLSSAGSQEQYHKTRWHKGLIGVVYEVTPEDYAHIIQTEGGGASYQDIQVDCHPFATLDPSDPVPFNPETPSFKAHTLFASESPSTSSTRAKRPDPNYAQPSARYLKLITDGAKELALPLEYQAYLQDIRPYTITTYRQRMGQVAFWVLWGPWLLFLFGLSKVFADEDGRMPGWLKVLFTGIFSAAWWSYDFGFRRIFGDGERTIGKGDDIRWGEGGRCSVSER